MPTELATSQGCGGSLETDRPALESGFRVAEGADARSGYPEALRTLGAELGDVLAEYRVAELRIEQLADALTQLQLVTEASEARARQSDSAAAEVHLARNESIELRHLLEQQASEWTAERTALATECDRLAAERSGMAAQQDRLASALVDLAARIRIAEQQRAHLRVERAELERRAARLAEQRGRAERRIALLEKGQEAADERARQWQIELTRTQEHLRVEQDGFTRSRGEFARSRDELARSIGWLADAVSDLGGRLHFAEQRAERAETAAATATERGAQIERHAAWADAQIAQFVEREAGIRTSSTRIIGREISESTDVLAVIEMLHRRQRELERELDRECSARERVSARLAEWERSRCAVIAASCCTAWRAMISALRRVPQTMGKSVGR